MLLCFGWEGSISYIQVIPKLIYKFTGIPVKIQIEFFCGTWKADYKIHMKDQGGKKIAKTVLESDKVKRPFLPNIHLIRLLLVQDQTVKPGEQNRMYNTYSLHCKSVGE